MLPAIGLVSSGLDALQSLFSSSSSQSTGSSQNVSNPFDVTTSSSSQAGTTSPPPIGTPGYQQISPQTMSALLDAQSQSGTSASTSSTQRSLSVACR